MPFCAFAGRDILIQCSLYDIIAHQKVIPELRKEIECVLVETEGAMTTQALFRMKLLDSVMRESQRVNPLNMGKPSIIPSLLLDHTDTL